MSRRNDKPSDIQLQRIKEYSNYFSFIVQQSLTKGDCSDIINIFVTKRILYVKNGLIDGTSIKAFNTNPTHVSDTVVLSGHEKYGVDYRGGEFLDKYNSHCKRNDSDVTIKEWKRKESINFAFYPIDTIK